MPDPTSAQRQRLDKATRDLRAMHVWPLANQLDVEGWLSNFAVDDEDFAIALLDAFNYFSQDAVLALLTAAFQQISVDEVGMAPQLDTAVRIWRSFCSSLILVPVAGEVPSPAESGHLFVRHARDYLGIPERNILDASGAIYELLRGGQRPVVFVDDFSGTGLQFRDFWRRSFRLVDGTFKSFQELEMAGKGTYYFAPLLMTQDARILVDREAPSVRIRPAYFVGREYYARSLNSRLWPVGRAAEGLAFLERQARRVGVDPGDKKALFGFGEFGLAVSFVHGTPDATLPIFSWNQAGFHPLLDRG